LIDAAIVFQRVEQFMAVRDCLYDRNDSGRKRGKLGDGVLDNFLIYSFEDGAAFCLFVLSWMTYAFVTDRGITGRLSLNALMNKERARWMTTMTSRELRVIDTAILAGLQQGTAFFASTSVFAIGGCFALMNASDQVIAVGSNLPVMIPSSRPMFETKSLLLLLIYSYAFFKFGWSYRLQNYCSILVGAVPFVADGATPDEKTIAAANKALIFNNLAGRHYNAGLRAIFFSIGFMGWFAGPYVFIGSTLFILAVLVRRQFFSRARAALLGD
jgi:uncharacterized membrane protein